ncbi:fasciclin-like arabinogalactan protein 12 [Oryza brachyantha]|nr:fasciclin-like arabinogalactan protein 12 [Oryza brachyantha]
MASSSSARLMLLAALLASAAALAAAQKATGTKPKAATPAASGPSAATADGPAPTNVTAVLEKSGKYTTFLRLLHESRVDTQINSQLMDSYNGLTMFAPTDAAFAALKPGTLNSLSSQDQIQLMLYCVLPRFYSLSMLTTLSGPVNTQASGADGPYKYKIKPSNNNVNISTGVNWALLSTVVSKDFPLAVYSVDKVPLPYELFGPKPPTPAPAPAPAPSKSKTKKHKKSTGIAEPPAADDTTAADTAKKAAAAATGVSRWVAAAGVLGGAIFAGLF